VLIPGIDLPENDQWQVQEQMIMQDDDYDFIINQGWDAFVQKTLPKVMDMELFEKNGAWMEANFASVADRYRNIGYMIASAGIATIPFEPICGARSMSKFYLDLYRMPDKVKAAMDVVAPVMTKQAIEAVKLSGVNGVWVGGWRTASAMIAPDIWNKLVWPYFRDVAMALIDEGITPVFHWDQNWDRDLERIKELPAKKCVLGLDGMTDFRLASKILKGHTALLGDVPAPLFATGTTEEVRTYVHDLVRDVGPVGLILASGCDAPMNTKPDNMKAFLDASREFGQGV
jgi:uroporphyrinogen-III decarboxylase